jgi:hypothetical protein
MSGYYEAGFVITMAPIPSHSRLVMPCASEGVIVEVTYGGNAVTTDSTGTPADFDRAIEAAVEAEICEFVRRDGASLRRAPETDSELVANSVVTLLQRVAGTSVQDIDRLISELQTLREILQEQGARVQRNLAEYAHLSQSAMQSTKIIAENLNQWRQVDHWSPHTPH